MGAMADMSNDPIDALARLNPVPDDVDVALPDGLDSISATIGRSKLEGRATLVAILAGALLGWVVIGATSNTAPSSSAGCVIIGGEVTSSPGICVVAPAP